MLAISSAETPASASACRIAAFGPSSLGVMMWCASELTPTASNSADRLESQRAHVVVVGHDPHRRASRDT
jgi:hypothetical protein